jgi:hypothetical protein
VRILHTVEFYEPSKGGAQEVVRQLSERRDPTLHAVVPSQLARLGLRLPALERTQVRLPQAEPVYAPASRPRARSQAVTVCRR